MDARLEIILKGVRDTIDELLAAEGGLSDAAAEAGKAFNEFGAAVDNAGLAEHMVEITKKAVSTLLKPPAPPEPGAVVVEIGSNSQESQVVATLDAVTPVDLDAECLPWDERIHSSGKTQYKTGANTGQWIIKKKTDPVYLAKIKTELRLKYPLAEAPPTPPATEIPTPPLTVTMPTRDLNASTGIPTPPEPMSWGELLAAVAGSGLTPEVVQAACQKYGVTNIGTLQDSPLMVPSVAKKLGLA